MEYLDGITAFLSHPWVSWGLTIIFAAAGIFMKQKLDGIKKVIDELVDVAQEHQKATDPKSEAGEAYSDKERAELQRQVQELIGALALLFKK